ncbi:S1 RNA-binding domain-containing protein [Oceanicoccus sp. KOV_DT_Chl]|uniref:CvfB family protein n=1 Tax=Oceanicoccus sp. KOV_DT_Chl TaxID=1904639 RepID=UPI000C7AF692|nr:S1-like domain-containing RNA-binding protein [Oceanicoccus sp. KOV_DT_Chl]
MAEIGRINTLAVVRESLAGVYLDGGALGEVLLPKARQSELASSIEVFIYPSADAALVATTKRPYAQVGEFAWLTVSEVNQVGAFLDWGLDKELLLPFAEQKYEPKVGLRVMVRVYLDNSQRIAASTRLDRYLQHEAEEYKPGQQVDVLVADTTDLGFKAIVDNRFWGMLFHNDLNTKLSKGQRLTAYIKRVREDKRLDLTLLPPAAEQVPQLVDQIIATLKEHGGYIMVSDKSSPETIYSIFKVSKKIFKKAIGVLYKQRRITIEEKGIRLLKD